MVSTAAVATERVVRYGMFKLMVVLPKLIKLSLRDHLHDDINPSSPRFFQK